MKSEYRQGAVGVSLCRRGFTLIELLVVIAIISLLLSILMPSLSTAKEHAKTMLCAANMRQIAQAMAMYAADNDGYQLPWGYRTDDTGFGVVVYYYDVLGNHGRGYFNCGQYLPDPRMHNDNPEDRLGTIWKCSNAPPSAGASDFGISIRVGPDWESDGLIPSRAFMLTDMTGIISRRGVSGPNSAGYIDISPGGRDSFRHLDSANFIYLDHHYERKSKEWVLDSVDDEENAENNAFWGY